MKSTEPPIILEYIFDSSLDAVWKALTVREEMVEWYFPQIEAFEAKVGFETQFVIENEGRTFTHQWKVTEVITHQLLTYSWNYKEHVGDSLVSFELKEENGQVKLTIRIDVLKTFPQNFPEFQRESGIAGWNYFLGKQLKAYLEN